MKKKILEYQETVLKALADKVGSFYLAGGTALSLFYFRHRLSVDLDFFTQEFDYAVIGKTVGYLSKTLGKNVRQSGLTLDSHTARMAVYSVFFTGRDALRLDFVEDTVSLLKPAKSVDGIRVLSLEDIYLRKLYAMVGAVRLSDDTGRAGFSGGRADAKDFYDTYVLSSTFMPLSVFMGSYGDSVLIEAVVRWFRTFKRMDMMDGVLGLDTGKQVDYKAAERHFRKEVDKIIDIELGGV